MPRAKAVTPGALPGQARLRLLATSDVHAHLLPFDYHKGRSNAAMGLARTASLIAQARREAARTGGASLLVDNGDFLFGSPLADYIAAAAAAKGPEPLTHPVIAAMNALGYAAAALGNHEFDGGLAFLESAMSGARFPLLCANLRPYPGTPAPLWLQKSTILTCHLPDGIGAPPPLRIGLLALTPPQLIAWAHDGLKGRFAVEDMRAAARAQVPSLRAAGADLVVLLAHSGLGPSGAEGEGGAENLAALPGVDAVVAGHSHLLFPSRDFAALPQADLATGLIGGRPVVMPGAYGSHLGVVDFALTYTEDRWQVLNAQAEVRPIAEGPVGGPAKARVRSAAKITALAAESHAATQRFLSRPIGESATPITSYFALVTETPVTRLLAEAQRRQIATLLRGTRHAGLPVLSAAAPFKAGGRGGAQSYIDIPPGPLTLRHLAELCPFSNPVHALRLSGAALTEWLERAAALFCQVTPGLTDQPLHDPAMPPYHFDTLLGLSYTIDLSVPARYSASGALRNPQARRIRALTYQGAPINPSDEFIVAANGYRAGGGGHVPGLAGGGATVFETTLAPRDLLAQFVQSESPLRLPFRPSWRFAPLPGTRVTFESAPKARAYIADTGLAITPLGPGDEGFFRYSLAL